jgi:hypothetical protein
MRTAVSSERSINHELTLGSRSWGRLNIARGRSRGFRFDQAGNASNSWSHAPEWRQSGSLACRRQGQCWG